LRDQGRRGGGKAGVQVEGVIDIKMRRRLYGEDVPRELQRHWEMRKLAERFRTRTWGQESILS